MGINSTQAMILQNRYGGMNTGFGYSSSPLDSYNCMNGMNGFYGYSQVDMNYMKNTPYVQRQKDQVSWNNQIYEANVQAQYQRNAINDEYSAPSDIVTTAIGDLKQSVELDRQDEVAININKAKQAVIAKLVKEGVYDPSEDRVRTELEKVYKTQTGELLPESLRAHCDTQFMKGIKDGIPIIGWFEDKNSAEDNIAKLQGKSLNRKDNAARIAGTAVSSCAGYTAVGAGTGALIAGPVGAVVGGLIGLAVGAFNTYGKATKLV